MLESLKNFLSTFPTKSNIRRVCEEFEVEKQKMAEHIAKLDASLVELKAIADAAPAEEQELSAKRYATICAMVEQNKNLINEQIRNKQLEIDVWKIMRGMK